MAGVGQFIFWVRKGYMEGLDIDNQPEMARTQKIDPLELVRANMNRDERREEQREEVRAKVFTDDAKARADKAKADTARAKKARADTARAKKARADKAKADTARAKKARADTARADKAQQQAWKAKNEKIQAGRARQKAQKVKSKKVNFVKDHSFIIDTNVWMNGETDLKAKKIFEFIVRKKKKVILPSVIYDEIMKKKEQGKKDHKSETSRKARSAMRKVRELQHLGLVTMTKVNIQYDKKAYADPQIIKGFKENTSNMILLSDDIDVVIRSSHFIQSNSSNSKAMLVAEFADGYC